MSLPQALGSFRRVRANSNPQSSPQVILGSSDPQPHETQSTRSNGTAQDINHGSIRGYTDAQAHNANMASNQREPTRSSVHMLSYRGPSGENLSQQTSIF